MLLLPDDAGGGLMILATPSRNARCARYVYYWPCVDAPGLTVTVTFTNLDS